MIDHSKIRTGVKDAVAKIGKSVSNCNFTSSKSYESKSYGDLTILTVSTKGPLAKKK